VHLAVEAARGHVVDEVRAGVDRDARDIRAARVDGDGDLEAVSAE
jgi:hypothetical protein